MNGAPEANTNQTRANLYQRTKQQEAAISGPCVFNSVYQFALSPPLNRAPDSETTSIRQRCQEPSDKRLRYDMTVPCPDAGQEAAAEGRGNGTRWRLAAPQLVPVCVGFQWPDDCSLIPPRLQPYT